MATTGIMNGTLLGVYAGSTLIAHATEGSISLSMDTRDATSKDSAGDRALLEATKSGTISVSALYAEDAAFGVDDLMTSWAARTSLVVKFSTEVTGDHYWSASAYISSIEVSAGMEDNVTYSCTFELTGAITYSAVA
jgi:TP901-1 family phage major tail protein